MARRTLWQRSFHRRRRLGRRFEPPTRRCRVRRCLGRSEPPTRVRGCSQPTTACASAEPSACLFRKPPACLLWKPTACHIRKPSAVARAVGRERRRERVAAHAAISAICISATWHEPAQPTRRLVARPLSDSSGRPFRVEHVCRGCGGGAHDGAAIGFSGAHDGAHGRVGRVEVGAVAAAARAALALADAADAADAAAPRTGEHPRR